MDFGSICQNNYNMHTIMVIAVIYMICNCSRLFPFVYFPDT